LLHITDTAAEYIKTYLNARASTAEGVYISVIKNGCTGYSYKLEIQRNSPDPDQCALYASSGVNVWVESKTALPMITGSVLDYVKKGLNSGFEFRNPNVTSECGCGESFTV